MADNFTTRFYDPTNDIDGPVIGAFQTIVVPFANGGNTATDAHIIDFMAGQRFEIVGINVQAVGITSDPEITVGTSKAGTEIVAAVNATTALGALTLKATSVAAGGLLDVRVVNDAGDAYENITVSVHGYQSGPPTTLKNY